jgi:integrase
MGWAEKLESGRYRAVYRDAAGKKRSVPGSTFTHKKAAVRAANAAEEGARKSTWRNPDRGLTSWGEWCDENWWPNRSVEATTRRMDQYRLEKYLKPRWSSEPLASITRQDVKAWAKDLAKTEIGGEDDAGDPLLISPSTVQRVVHLFSASLTAAMDAEILTSNPAWRLKLPPSPPAQERYLTHDEYELVRAELPADLDVLIEEVLANTGLRWGEMAGAHFHRLNPLTGTLQVVETWDPTERKIKAYPKGKKIRDVPVPRWLIEKLEDWSREPMCGLPHKTGKCRSGLLIPAPRGGALDGGNWNTRVWAPAVERAGIGHARPHDLRHSYASWQLHAGRSLEEIGRLLGHVSPLTTQKYSHLAATATDHILAALPGAPRAKRGANRVPDTSSDKATAALKRQQIKAVRGQM